MKSSEKSLDPAQKEALKAAREIAVKFIETGRISPVSFAEVFPSIYEVVLTALRGAHPPASTGVTPDRHE